jgi:hypothetical protein
MIDALLLAGWLGLWALGGVWLAGAAFRLEKGERLLVGLALGLALENLLANLLARLLPLPVAVFAAAGLTALIGLVLVVRQDGWCALPRLPLAWRPLLALAALSLLAFGLGRGMGLFDDFVHLPTVSLMAAGGVPPRFVLDPAIPYEYHYFLLFTAAQVMRIGGIPPWSALDLLRGLTTGLALVLSFYWARRMTRSSTAGVLGAAFVFFASGARWLLLLLPENTLRAISSGMELLGSAADSGADLGTALASSWAVEGAGPIPFPFAFGNGIVPPGVLVQFVANGLTEQAFILALLLVFSRRRGWTGGLAAALIISSMGLLTEAGVVLELAGLGLVGLVTLLRGKGAFLARIPRSLWAWLSIVLGGHLLGAWQGGALWGILLRALGTSQAGDYHTISFRFAFPPTVVSAHLGVLSLGNPGQALVALAELGPLLLVLPLLLIWGWKAARAGRWFEAALAGEALCGLTVLFIQFTGSEGIRNTPRLYRFPFILVLMALPLAWNWLKSRGQALRWTGAGLAGVTLMGGLGLFAAQLPALQKPVYSYFISEMDATIFDHNWNRLPAGALVFDLVPYRAPTLLGRYTDSSVTWYAIKPEWKKLFLNPLPGDAHAYGFDYAYMDNFNFAKLDADLRQAWDAPCVRLVEEASYEGYWRRLYDIRNCP